MYGRYFSPSIISEFERLQRDMNRFLGHSVSRQSAIAPSYPAVNMWSKEDTVTVVSELPGMKPDDIDITVIGDTLTISGVRKPEEAPANAKFHRQERGCGKFARTIQLPYQMNTDKVEAVFDRGVLKISMVRAETDKPKKINVKNG